MTSVGRAARFAELDGLIAHDPEVREWRNYASHVPIEARARPRPTVREMMRVIHYYQLRACFICQSRKICLHREPGVALAVMQRPARVILRDYRGRWVSK